MSDPAPSLADDAVPPEPAPAPAKAEPALAPAKVDPETLVLRARAPRAIRFKRGAIVSLAALAAAGVVGTAWFALEPRALRFAANSDDDRSVIAKPPIDTLSALPMSYATAPKLGPPLPGDLGRPILDQQRQMAVGPMPPATASDQTANEEKRRRVEALQAARRSGVLVQTSSRGASDGAAAAAPPLGPPADVDAAAKVALDPQADPNGQQHKSEFVASTDKSGDVNPFSLVASPSPYTLSAGSVITASLITGLRSDLPGMVTAQVTERVFDSATGRILLIPQGARLIGMYDSVVAFGQKRALVVWQRLLMPDGSSVRFANAPATDPSGYAGLEDKVDFHTWTLLKGVVLSTLLGVGAELQFGGEGDLVQALRQSTQQSVSRAGDQLTSRNLQIQPTITIRPGTPVRLVVHQDLVLKPWKEGRDG